jgi:hypothetical protein
MLVNFLIFVSVLLLIFVLLRVYKSLKIVEHKEKEKCKFRISKPRFSNGGPKKFANFTVYVDNKHTFFVDFPISFRFYSNTRFKSKVKISYETPSSGKNEELVNKTVTFETKEQESKRFITDIIVGKIDFEIELDVDYGHPRIDFEILENPLCDLRKEHKLTIKFPK